MEAHFVVAQSSAGELRHFNTRGKLEAASKKEVKPPAVQEAKEAAGLLLSKAAERRAKAAKRAAEVKAAEVKAAEEAKKAAGGMGKAKAKAKGKAKGKEEAEEEEEEGEEEEEEVEEVEPPPRKQRVLPRGRGPPAAIPRVDVPPRSPAPRSSSLRPPQPSPSPPGSVRQLKKMIRGLKQAQAIPGQVPADLAARAQQLDGYECDLDERMRQKRKYGRW